MATRAQRRKLLREMQRAIIPQAVRPPLRIVVTGNGQDEKVIEPGDVNNEHWDRFPMDEIRQINFVVVTSQDTGLGRLSNDEIETEAEVKKEPQFRFQQEPESEPEIISQKDRDDSYQIEARRQRENAIRQARSRSTYNRG